MASWHPSRLLACCALAFGLLLWAPAQAFSQHERTIVWLPGVDAGATIPAAQLEQIFHEILGADRTSHHVIGRRGLAHLVERGGFTLPRCLQGYEPCLDAAHAVLQSIGADLVARVIASGDGSTLHLELLDSDLVPIEEQTLRDVDPRRAVYAAINQVTDATAWLIVQASPVEGVVFLDGRELGPSPWQGSLGIGTWTVEVQAPGYYDWNQTIELRAGDNRTVRAELARRFGDVRVRSGLPGAQVFVDDGDEAFPTNTFFSLPPGQYVIELRAPGFDPAMEFITLAAGDEFDFRLDLRESLATLHARELEHLRARPLLLEASLTWSTSSTDFEDASGRAHGAERTVRCVADETGCAPGGVSQQHFGLDLGVAYQRGALEIPVLGLGIRTLAIGGTTPVLSLRGADEFVTFDGGREILLRLPGAGARWLINHRFEPWARAGFAIAFETWQGRETGVRREDVRFTRTNLLFEARGGLRFHFNRLFFAFGEGHIAPSVNQGPATRYGLSAGVGLNLPFAGSAPPTAPEAAP